MFVRTGMDLLNHDVIWWFDSSRSAKMIGTIDSVIKPLVDEGGEYYGKVKVIFRPQVQPWHATSTYTHEAGLAVGTKY